MIKEEDEDQESSPGPRINCRVEAIDGFEPIRDLEKGDEAKASRGPSAIADQFLPRFTTSLIKVKDTHSEKPKLMKSQNNADLHSFDDKPAANMAALTKAKCLDSGAVQGQLADSSASSPSSPSPSKSTKQLKTSKPPKKA